MAQKKSFDEAQAKLILQLWLQRIFPSLTNSICLGAGGIGIGQWESVKNQLLATGWINIVAASGTNAVELSDKCTAPLCIELLATPSGRAFFEAIVKGYNSLQHLRAAFNVDATPFQLELARGMMFGSDDSLDILFSNFTRFRAWIDQAPGNDASVTARFLANTIFNADFLAAAHPSPAVAAIILARFGYRLLREGESAMLMRYCTLLAETRDDWMKRLADDRYASIRVLLSFFFYLVGRIDLMLDLQPTLPDAWQGISEALLKSDADTALSGLRKLVEALPVGWQNVTPKAAFAPALVVQMMLLVGLRSGKAVILQTERQLAALSDVFESSSPLWQHVKSVPFPAEAFVWDDATNDEFAQRPLALSLRTLFASFLLRDAPQNAVPPDFKRFALAAFTFFKQSRLALPAYFLKAILQNYLPDDAELGGMEMDDLPLTPLFLPEARRSEAETRILELVKILQEARERKDRDDGDQETKEFGFQIELRRLNEAGTFQIAEAAPCLVTRTKRGFTRLKRVALSRVKRGQYDQIMDKNDHVIANLIQPPKGADDENDDLAAISFTGTTAAILETPRKFFLKGDNTPLLIKVEPLRLSIEINPDSLGIKIPAPLPSDISDPYFLQRAGHRSYTVTVIDEEVKKLFTLLQNWGKDGQRKIKITGRQWKKIADLVPSFSQVSPYLQILGTGKSMEDVASATVAGEVNLELRIGIAPEGGYRLEMFCHPIPDDPGFAIKPGQDAAGILRSTAEGAMAVTRDLHQEKFKAESVVNSCPALKANPDVPYQWDFARRGALLEFIAQFQQMNDPSIKLTFPENKAWSVTSGAAKLHFTRMEKNDRGWFEIGAEIRVDENRVLRLMDLLKLGKEQEGGFVDLGGDNFIRIGEDTLRQLEMLDLYRARANSDKVSVPQGFVPLLADLQESAGGDTPEIITRVRDEFRSKLAVEPELPTGLDVTLRPYQETAVRWLLCHYACSFGGACLADDMGLGKTIELLVLLKAVANKGPSLVVVPTSLATNWCQECAKVSKKLRIFNFAEQRDADLTKLKAGDIAVVSYGLLIKELERFSAVQWNVCILDEAQAIKNTGAQRTSAAKKLSAAFRIIATGTPIENNLSEFWSLFDFIVPGLLGNHTRFKELFVDVANQDEGRQMLKKLVAPFILRRLKKDVLQDLPPKTEIMLPVELSSEERDQYESIRRAAVERAKDADDRMSLLASLMRLRRTCCHPALVIPKYKGETSKMDKLLELAAQLKRNGHRALVFSQFVDMLSLVKSAFDKEGLTYQYLDGGTAPKDRNAAVAAFQGGEGDFFLISLKAGGTGLTLTAADYVIILDPWWNPAVESQAADRAHRIGQQRPVTIYRLIVKETVEEKVVALHAVKKQLVEDILSDTSEAALTPKELLALFK